MSWGNTAHYVKWEIGKFYSRYRHLSKINRISIRAVESTQHPGTIVKLQIKIYQNLISTLVARHGDETSGAEVRTKISNYGSVLGLFLLIQIITGVILSTHYVPDIKSAFLSLVHIRRDVKKKLRHRHHPIYFVSRDVKP